MILLSEKKILYTPNIEINETDGEEKHIYRLGKIYETQELLIAERDKRNQLSIKYNTGVNIIGVIDNCLGVTAIWYNGSWSSLNNRCCTSRYWNGSSIN